MGRGVATTMIPTVSLVLVSYHSSAEVAGAVESFRAEAGRIVPRAEVVIVDHSGDGSEEARLRQLAPDQLLIRPNLGYAAGVNAGVAASVAPTVLVGNPDITFQKGSVAGLVGALDDGWDIVGPQFVLGRFLFPPSDAQTPGEEVRRFLAACSRMAWAHHFRRELARWRRVWEASAPVAVPTLSGALLAFQRDTFDRLGPWDEGYFLYFEETDWLRRAAASGLRIAQVPGANVEHRWGHAADPAAMGPEFERSRRRFMKAHFGLCGTLVAGRDAGRSPLRPQPASPIVEELPLGERLWLLSPTRLGLPAACFRGTRHDVVAAAGAFVRASRRPVRNLLIVADSACRNAEGVWWWGPSDG